MKTKKIPGDELQFASDSFLRFPRNIYIYICINVVFTGTKNHLVQEQSFYSFTRDYMTVLVFVDNKVEMDS